MLFQLFPYHGISQKITFVRHTGVNLRPLWGGHHCPSTLTYCTPTGKLRLKGHCKKISDPYFIFIWLIFYSYLCLQLWKYNPSTFLTTIYKEGHKMEILLHYSICIDVFFFCVHVPLSVYFLSPSVVFSATVSIPNVYIGSSTTLL